MTEESKIDSYEVMVSINQKYIKELHELICEMVDMFYYPSGISLESDFLTRAKSMRYRLSKMRELC